MEPDPTPPAPEPKPDEDRTGKVSVDELNNNHANNIVLGNVTITTGTSSDSGKDFVVGYVRLASIDVQLRTSEHRSMYSYVRLSIDRCTATYV